MSSVSLFPEQVAALQQLLTVTDGFAVDISPDEHRSLRAAVFTQRDPDAEPDGELAEARWFSVSVAGTVREREMEDQQVAA